MAVTSLNPNASAVSVAMATLASVYPIGRLVHVGYGKGQSDVCGWTALPFDSAVVIDAQPVKDSVVLDHPDIEVIQTIVSAEGGTRDFTESSLKRENSLRTPEQLRAVYPHVKHVKTTPKETQALPECASDLDSANWLIIDCEPALAILPTLKSIPQLDVVLCLGDSVIDNPDLSHHFTEAGFRSIECADARGDYALFVRDGVTLKRQLSRVKALEDELSGVKGSESEALSRVKALEDELSGVKGSESEALSRVKALEDELSGVKGSESEALSRVKALEDELSKALDKCANTETQNHEIQTRYRILQDEVTKAEGQVQLITELLLKGNPR